MRRPVAVSLARLRAAQFVTGGAVGLDSYAGRLLVLLNPGARHQVIVPADRSRVDPWWYEPQFADRVELVEMPPGTSYAERNQALVDAVVVLYAFVGWPEDHPRSLRSGSWQTVRMARRAGKPAHVTVLCDTAV